MQGALTQFSAF